jgi:hypothetical protein
VLPRSSKLVTRALWLIHPILLGTSRLHSLSTSNDEHAGSQSAAPSNRPTPVAWLGADAPLPASLALTAWTQIREVGLVAGLEACSSVDADRPTK